MSELDPWVAERPNLLRLEMELARGLTSGRIARDGATIVFEEEIRAHGVSFGYQIRYAPDHPFTAPTVLLLWPDLPKTREVHRFSDGSLCLHAEEEWLPTRTGALWLRNRAVAWIVAVGDFSRTGVWDMNAGRHV